MAACTAKKNDWVIGNSMATVECPICLDSESEIVICEDNGHRACKDCMRSYILTELKEKGNMHCPIPDCPDPLTIEVLHGCLADEPINVRQEAVLHYRRKVSDSTRSCDFCGGAVTKRQKSGVLKYRCQICAKHYCPRCQMDEHPGACKEDKDIADYAESEEIDRCPNCGVLATKDGASCNSVTCTQCGHHFAWKNRATLWSREAYGEVAHVWKGDTVHQNDPLIIATAEAAAAAGHAELVAEADHVLQRRVEDDFVALRHAVENIHQAALIQGNHWVDQHIERYLTEENINELAGNKAHKHLPYFTVIQLKDYCRRHNIRPYSNVKKAELLRMILRRKEDAAADAGAEGDAELARRLQMEFDHELYVP
jgi:hypothetical protein